MDLLETISFHKKKAIVANKKNKLNLADKMSQISKNNQIKIEEAENLKSKIEGKTIKIDMEANDDGKLYGAINQKFIVEQVKQSLSVELQAESIIPVSYTHLRAHET